VRKPNKSLLDIIKKYGLIPIDESGGGGTLNEETGEFESGGYQIRFLKIPDDPNYPKLILTISQNPSKPDYSTVVDELNRYEKACKCSHRFVPFHEGTEHVILLIDVLLGFKQNSWVGDRRLELYEPTDPIWAKCQLSWMLYDWFIELQKRRGAGRPKKSSP